MTDEHEIVPVDHLVTASEAENTFDLRRLPPHDLGGIEIRIGNDPPGDLDPVGSQNAHGVAALESPTGIDHASRQKTLPLQQRAQSARVDTDRAGGTQCSRYPLFAGRDRRGGRNEPGTTSPGLDPANRVGLMP